MVMMAMPFLHLLFHAFYAHTTLNYGGITMSELGNIIFSRAVLYIDTDGDNIELAELQNLSFETRDTMKTAEGKDIWPVAKRLASRNVTIRAQWLRVQAQGLAKLNGGVATYANNKTTVTISSDSIPSSFKMELSNPSDGSEIKLTFFNVTPMNFTFPLTLKEFSMPSVEFEVSADENGKVYSYTLPGYQSTD